MTPRGPLHPELPFDMRPRAAAAVRDIQLTQFVSAFTRSKDTGRRSAMHEAFGERTDAVRDLAGRIKQHTLDHLDWYLDQFIDRAERAGATVHFAPDAARANQICVEVAARNSCRLCVKSKSMVTEETALVPALEAAGIETVETDLGEFIIQLDGDAPSHIVAPMIHKDRTAVGRAFARTLGVPYTDDPQRLAEIARSHLREKYGAADLGVTGANFLIADSGSLVLCTNEGNGRFCSTAPRTVISVAGIEKLIPRLDHLAVMLKVLARSATSQPLTCYTHILTGPRLSTERHGPEELHIVLVNAGRSNILHEGTRELLRCIRCGACLNACPVYRSVGGHAYGSVYSGPIGAAISPLLKGLQNYPDLPKASSLCGACHEACPVNINIPRQLIRLRERMVRQRITGRAPRLAYRTWSAALRIPWIYRVAGRLHRALAWALAGDGGRISASPTSTRAWISRAPGPLRAWTDHRDLPTPAARSFREWWNLRGRDA